MSFKTVSELTQQVIKLVGLVPGTTVQNYTEPQIEASIQRMFDMLYRKRNWDWLSQWETYTIDGTTGLLTTDINGTIEDIGEIYISGTDRRVPRPVKREHLHVTGSGPLYYTPLMSVHASFQTKVIKFWPITAVGNVDIFRSYKPADFITSDTVPFPADVLAQACAWDLLMTDGINSGAAQKAQVLYDISYNDLIAKLSSDVIGHGNRSGYVPLAIRTL